MKIETKFNPGERVWTLINNKSKEVEIYEVIPGMRSLNLSYKDQYTIVGYNGNSPKFYDNDIFKTKEELINSL